MGKDCKFLGLSRSNVQHSPIIYSIMNLMPIGSSLINSIIWSLYPLSQEFRVTATCGTVTIILPGVGIVNLLACSVDIGVEQH